MMLLFQTSVCERRVCFWSSWFSRPTNYHFIHSGHILFCTCMLQSRRFDVFGRWFLFSKFFSSMCSAFLLLFIFKNSTRIFCELYFSNSFKFLAKALSSLQNACYITSQFITASKIIVCDNILCFCLVTQEMYQKLNII